MAQDCKHNGSKLKVSLALKAIALSRCWWLHLGSGAAAVVVGKMAMTGRSRWAVASNPCCTPASRAGNWFHHYVFICVMAQISRHFPQWMM